MEEPGQSTISRRSKPVPRNGVGAHKQAAAPKAQAPTKKAGALAQRTQAALDRAKAELRAGQFEKVIAAYDEVLALQPDNVEALVNKGAILHRLGRHEAALACSWRATQVAPERPELWVNAANALVDMGRLEEGRTAIESALVRNPFSVEAWQSLATLLIRRKQERAAEIALRRAHALAPKNPVPLLRLAEIVAHEDRRLLEAKALAESVLKLAPDMAAAHSSYAQMLLSLGRFDESAPHFRRALEIDPKNLDAHLGSARLALLKGDLEAGWVEYEWRRHKFDSKTPRMDGPEWDGSPIPGKTLLVYGEQGFGDMIQFVRLMPRLAEMGIRVILAVPEALENLLQGFPGTAQVVTKFRKLGGYDYHVPLLTLPLRLGITLATIPKQGPYIKPPPAPPPLPVSVGTRLRVGLVWAGRPTHGKDRDRSIDLEKLLPIAGLTGVELYSLQIGPHARDIARYAHGALIRDLSPQLKDFTDTAGAIAQLDLVISADTAVAHLAAAMGKPVWTMLPFAPDWRWILGRDDTPWYPTMRLFRQTEPGQWEPVVGRVVDALRKVLAKRPALGLDGDVVFKSVFMDSAGQPRFQMAAPRKLMADPGIRFLVKREREGTGYEFATRCFIDEHLAPGDIFIDVGAHWGIMSLQAVTRWPGQIQALAIEPLKANLPFLKGWVAHNGQQERIEMIAAAAGAAPARGKLRPESTMGHSIVLDDTGEVAVVTVDGLLRDRPKLAGRKAVIKIDVEGSEPDVIAGMSELLTAGLVKAVIWERGVTYNDPEGRARAAALRQRFADLGFTAWRFEAEEKAGKLVPYVENGKPGNIFELVPGIAPAAIYDAVRLRPEAQPADPAVEAMRTAAEACDTGHSLQKAGKTEQALVHYATAAAFDQRLPDLYNNLGIALRQSGRLAAAEACYRRSLGISPSTGTLSNLGNVLNERGSFAEADAAHVKAIAQKPDDAGSLHNLGITRRDQGKPAKAQRLFERSLELAPSNVECRWDLALCRLQQGDYERGFPGYETRWGLKRNPTRKLDLPRWDGAPLKGRSIFLQDEQGYGDVLMFARFIPEVKRRGAGKIVLECQPELMRLMAATPGVDQVVPRGSDPKPCETTIPLLELAALFGTTLQTLSAKVPYLRAPAPEMPLPLPPGDKRLKLGLVWAGKTTPRDRSCPLDQLIGVIDDPRFAVFSLQVGPRAADLKALGADLLITDLAPRLHDFAETAAVLKQLDLLLTIDTSVAHLAGALGVPTFTLLRYVSDWRWFDQRSDSPWYPSMRLFRQSEPNDWSGALAEVMGAMMGEIAEMPIPNVAAVKGS